MKTCKWKITSRWDDDDFWNTGCGNAHQFSEGSIKDNGYKYCPYCGGKIVIEKGK